MLQSESIKELAAALVKAQAEISHATKNSKNPHFGSKYADISAVIDAVKPALNKYGLVFLQAPEPSENGEARLTTRLMHSSGEWIESTITVPMSKKDAQGYGSATTYARRYSLSAMTGLPQEDDDGNAASKPKGKTISASKESFEKLSPEMKEEVKRAADQAQSVMPDMEQALNIINIFCDSYPEDEDVKPGLWHCLNSKTRSAIKAHQLSQKGQ